MKKIIYLFLCICINALHIHASQLLTPPVGLVEPEVIAQIKTQDCEIIVTGNDGRVMHVPVRSIDEARILCKAISDIKKIDKEVTVSFVVPIYNEMDRLKPQSDHNRYGEDALRRTVEELQVLHRVNRKFKWHLIYVDDEPPYHPSSIVAAQMWDEVKKEHAQKGEVLDKSQFKLLKVSKEEKEGAKAGAVMKGLAYAYNMKWAKFVLSMDADKSISTISAGSLIFELFYKKAEIAIASRWMKGAVTHNMTLKEIVSSKLYIKIVHFILKDLRDITDIQRGFKAYTRKAIYGIYQFSEVTNPAYDAEHLILAKVLHFRISQVPICWYDSHEASNVGKVKAGIPMVRTLFKIKNKLKYGSGYKACLEYLVSQ